MSEPEPERNERYLQAPPDTAVLPLADEIVRPAVQLRELDLISEESPGTLRTSIEQGIWSIEADHPDGGPWLYGRDGVDTIVASRLRSGPRLAISDQTQGRQG